MMKIVLVRPNYESHIITPPLGLGYLASYLNRHGIEATILDGLRDNLSSAATVSMITAERPDAVGITVLTAYYHEAVNLCRRLKAERLRCILGGVHPTFLPFESLADSGADFVVCGEGEIALLKLAQNDFVNPGIPGVYSKATPQSPHDSLVRGEIVHDLDSLPFPDWAQIDPNTYPKAPHGTIARNYPIGSVATTRGCPNRCAYCASPNFYNRRVRFRSPENVVEEIAYLISHFGVREIHFEDNNLTLNANHIARICTLLLERGIRISWACPNGVRPDSIRDEELLRLMKASGCYCLALGIETVNPRVREIVKKDETMEDVSRAIRLIRRAGIECQGFFIFGMPGETRETMNETVSFARDSGLTRAEFQIFDVLPGSEFWFTLQGQFAPNWRKRAAKEPEWIPAGLTKEALRRAQGRAFWQFYTRPAVVWRMLRSVRLGQVRHLYHRLKEYHVI